MTGVLFVVYGLWCLIRTAPLPGRAEAGSGPRGGVGAGSGSAGRRSLSAAVLFLVIWAAMYTAFGKYPGDWLAIPKAVKYWMGQHAIARIPGPWWYYFPQLVYYDTAILVAAPARLPLAGLALGSAPADDPRRDAPARACTWRSTRGSRRSAGRPSLIALGVFLAAFFVAGWVLKPPPESTLSPFLQFIAFWAVGSLAIYAWAREKVPG